MKSKIKTIALLQLCNWKKSLYHDFSRHFSSYNFYGANYKQETKRKRSVILCSSLGFSLLGYVCYKFYCSKFCLNECFKQLTIIPQLQAAEQHREDLLKNESKATPRALFNFLADVAEKTSPSVVYIEIAARHPVTRKNIPVSNGSGFIVRSDGLILTNAHVVSHYGRVIVKLYDGKEYEGTVEHLDTETDLATVRIKAKDLPILPLGQSSKLRAGEFVIAMGNPLTLSHTITAGVISSANRQGKDLGLHKKSDYIQTDAAVNVGNSGGPLVNLDGEAIGINTMKVTEGISFAIPSDRAIEFLKRIESKSQGGWIPFSKKAEPDKKKYLGITMLTLTPSIVQELRERNPEFPNVSHGIMVWRVMVDSPSYVCGIRHGDIITSINGKEIYAASDVYKLLQSEDVLKIRILRNKREFDVIVELLDPVLP